MRRGSDSGTGMLPVAASVGPALGCWGSDSIRPCSDFAQSTPRSPRRPVSKEMLRSGLRQAGGWSHKLCTPPALRVIRVGAVIILISHPLPGGPSSSGSQRSPGPRPCTDDAGRTWMPHTHPVGSDMPQVCPHSARETSESLPWPVRIVIIRPCLPSCWGPWSHTL